MGPDHIGTYVNGMVNENEEKPWPRGEEPGKTMWTYSFPKTEGLA